MTKLTLKFKTTPTTVVQIWHIKEKYATASYWFLILILTLY